MTETSWAAKLESVRQFIHTLKDSDENLITFIIFGEIIFDEQTFPNVQDAENYIKTISDEKRIKLTETPDYNIVFKWFEKKLQDEEFTRKLLSFVLLSGTDGTFDNVEFQGLRRVLVEDNHGKIKIVGNVISYTETYRTVNRFAQLFNFRHCWVIHGKEDPTVIDTVLNHIGAEDDD